MGLRSSVQSQTGTISSLQVDRSTGGQTVAGSMQQSRQQTSITTAAKDFVGLSIAETYIDEDSKTVYALAQLDLSAVDAEARARESSIDNELQQLGAIDAPGYTDFIQFQKFKKSIAEFSDFIGLCRSKLDTKVTETGDKLIVQYRNMEKKFKLAVRIGFVDGGPQVAWQKSGFARAATNAGFSWTESNPSMALQLQNQDGPYYAEAYGMNVARMSEDVLLLDASGQVVQTGRLAVKGVGVNAQAAEMDLEKKIGDQEYTLLKGWISGDMQ